MLWILHFFWAFVHLFRPSKFFAFVALGWHYAGIVDKVFDGAFVSDGDPMLADARCGRCSFILEIPVGQLASEEDRAGVLSLFGNVRAGDVPSIISVVDAVVREVVSALPLL